MIEKAIWLIIGILVGILIIVILIFIEIRDTNDSLVYHKQAIERVEKKIDQIIATLSPSDDTTIIIDNKK